MTWETRQWLAETPVSALHKLRPYRDLIMGGLVVILLVLVGQQVWVMIPSPELPLERRHHPLAGAAPGSLGGGPALPPRHF